MPERFEDVLAMCITLWQMFQRQIVPPVVNIVHRRDKAFDGDTVVTGVVVGLRRDNCDLEVTPRGLALADDEFYCGYGQDVDAAVRDWRCRLVRTVKPEIQRLDELRSYLTSNGLG